MAAFKVGFSSLTRGELYPILKAERTESVFYGKTVNGIKLTLLDEELEIITYLPKKCVDELNDANVDAINTAGGTSAKFTVCYYGMVVTKQITTFYGKVHSPGESRNAKLFEDVTKMMEKYSTVTPEKRKSDDTSNDSPSKAAKTH